MVEPVTYTPQNDVEEGGATRFTDLSSGPVTFQPQKGKAILWPSVLADQPHTIDPRTHHEALPVTRGEKFGGIQSLVSSPVRLLYFKL